MNIKNTVALYSVSMLVTRNGYLVKVHKTIDSKWYSKICFFVDKDFNFRPWMLTERNGEPLLPEEFYRLRAGRNMSIKLSEIGTLTPAQRSKAIALGVLVGKDPYYGLSKELKTLYVRKNTLAQYQQKLDRVYSIATEKSHPFTPAFVKKEIQAPTVLVTAPKKESVLKKAFPIAPVVQLKPRVTKTGIIANDLSMLGSILAMA